MLIVLPIMRRASPDRNTETRHLLLEHIERTGLDSGSRLPSEALLATEFGVSRNTVREVLTQMETEGLLLRSHGVGTTLRQIPAKHGTYQSFPRSIENSGCIATVDVAGPLDCILENHVLAELQLDRNQSVKRIERVIFADKHPVVFVVDYIASHILERVDDWATFDGDMIALICRITGDTRFTQNRSVSAIACDERVAAKLAVKKASPVAHVFATLQSMNREPLVVTDSYICSGGLPLEYTGTIRVTPDV